MSAAICNLLAKLDEVRDDLACREHDIELNPEDDKAFTEAETLRRSEADITNELKGLGYAEKV